MQNIIHIFVIMEEKSTHGGKRNGAGRPVKEETTTINFRVKKALSQSIKDHIRPIIKELNK